MALAKLRQVMENSWLKLLMAILSFDPITEEYYRLIARYSPDFDNLLEGEWLPAKFKMNNAENQAFNEGLDAQIYGTEKGANPYLSGTQLHGSWDMRWQQGADEDYKENMNQE